MGWFALALPCGPAADAPASARAATRRAFQLRVVNMGAGSSEPGSEGGPEAADAGAAGGEEGAPAGATFEQQVAAAQARKKAEAAQEFVRVRRAQCSGEGPG